MTDSPKGQDAPDQEVDADLLAELAASFGAPRAVPARAARGGGVVTDDVKDVSDDDGAAGHGDPARIDGDGGSSSSNDSGDVAAGDAGRLARVRNRLRQLGSALLNEILYPRTGLTVSLVYIVFAIALTWKLLLDPVAKILAGNPYDQYYFEWQLTWVEHALLHFQNPFFTHAMNAPDGMNVEANPQIIGPAAVLTPVTYLFGAPVSFALLTTFNLCGTAITWRWFLKRHVVKTETAAFVGGLFAGFSPSVMSHSLAHPNLAGQWLVPLILGRVLRLREPEHTTRNGIVLGLMIAAQVFVGEELLFLTAMGVGAFLLAYAAMRPRLVRAEGGTFLKGAGIAIATTAVLLAYPLAFQFAGPMSFKGIPFDIGYYSADLKSYAVYPSLELWGDPDKLDPLAPGATEQAALVGWALLLVVALLAAWCIRNLVVPALLIAAAVLLVLSTGPKPMFDHKPVTWWGLGPQGLWDHIHNWPLFSSSLPIRSALAVSWIIGILLAIGVDKAVQTRFYWLRGLAVGAVAAALVPLIPRVLDVWDRKPIPAYFTTSAWKECLSPGHHTIVGVPLSSGGDRTNETWSTAADTAFDIPQGPVMAPDSADNKEVRWGRENILWTAQWLSYIYNNGGGSTPPVDAGIKNRVALDLATWKANCVVVADDNQNFGPLKAFLDQAVAPGMQRDGVMVWKEPTH
ncbi:MAG: hypothetical protein JF587_21950 [Catenulisporales bacterium]|nr:hypothetical protein [Catenulisporales bacterium]